MKTYLEKSIEAINKELFRYVGTTTQVIHETSEGNIIVMKGLKTFGNDYYSKEKNIGTITLIGPNDKIYIQTIS
jgi:transcriptional regulator of heat shock response